MAWCGKPILALITAAAAVVLVAALSPVDAQQRARMFDIPEQPLSSALVEYSRTSGVVIVAAADLLAGRRAPAVRGELTPEAALRQLLAGSGLESQRRPEGGIALVASPASVLPAVRAPSPQVEEEEVLSDIVVTGERLETTALAYAEAIALAPTSADQYARWHARLCPSVAGLAPADAQGLIDHIARRAYELGVRIAPTGCQPNLVIIFAPDPDLLAREVVETRRDLLGFYDSDGVTTAGRASLQEFAETPRAVRWWHVSHTAATDGQQLDGASPSALDTGRTGVAEPTFDGSSDVAALQGERAVRAHASRVRRATRQDFSFALIIVDARRAAAAPPPAVADYLAMAALAPLDPHAEMSPFSSILNLFSERRAGEPAPVAMTVWDLAYLQGLYAATPEAASARQQRRDIARHMVEQVALD